MFAVMFKCGDTLYVENGYYPILASYDNGETWSIHPESAGENRLALLRRIRLGEIVCHDANNNNTNLYSSIFNSVKCDTSVGMESRKF